MDKQTKKEIVLTIMILSFSLSIAILIVLFIPNEPASDFSFYYQTAIKFADKQPFYSLTKPMGYPILLGAWYKLTNTQTVLSGKVLNLIMFGLSLLMLGLLSRHIKTPAVSKYIFLGLVSFNPVLLFFTNVLGVETATLLILTLISYVYLIFSGKHLIQLVSLGVLIGILATLKSYFLVLPIVLFVIDVTTGRRIIVSLARFLVISAIFLIMISPFIVKNYKLTGNLILLPNNSDIVLYINNNDNNIHGGYMKLSDITPQVELLNELEHIQKQYGDTCPECIKLYGKYAKKWIFTNPTEFLVLGTLRWGRIFFYPGMVTWAVNQNTCSEPPCGDLEFRRILNFLQRVSDFFMFILSSILVLLVTFFIIDIPRTVFRGASLDPTLGYSFFMILFQLVVYYFGEGQPRYIHTFVLFGMILLFYTLESKVKISLTSG